ncbi:MAG: malto-oligosyltrehalose synthase, partial [Acetobacteraceae bacterium]
ARRVAFPHALLAAATHDHKRGEAVRARLAVLSEIPAEWEAAVEGWMRRNDGRRRPCGDGPAPSAADELMLYQMLVAAWPAALEPTDTRGVARFCERIAAWQEKAVREAKLRSDWLAIDAAYEDACRKFLLGMLEDAALRDELERFARRIGPAGAVNGLAQTMLRLTVPGVPDLYQGTEFWDESLVDPDNRRPVDFAAREAALGEGRSLAELVENWRSGRIKQALIARMLGLRKRLPELFASGSYVPLEANGIEAKRTLFFMRVHERTALVVGLARLAVPLLGTAAAPRIASEAWGGTYLCVPGAAAGAWNNVLEAEAAIEGGGPVPLGLLFGSLPVACWLDERIESGGVSLPAR